MAYLGWKKTMSILSKLFDFGYEKRTFIEGGIYPFQQYYGHVACYYNNGNRKFTYHTKGGLIEIYTQPSTSDLYQITQIWNVSNNKKLRNVQIPK